MRLIQVFVDGEWATVAGAMGSLEGLEVFMEELNAIDPKGVYRWIDPEDTV